MKIPTPSGWLEITDNPSSSAKGDSYLLPPIPTPSGWLNYNPVFEESKAKAFEDSLGIKSDPDNPFVGVDTSGVIPKVEKPTSAGSVGSSSVPQSVVDYLSADLARHYGMSKETAYQEALSNTSYQRAVKDMQSAGLNPAVIFGSGKGYTAGGVSYVSSAGSGSSGGGSGSGFGSSGKLFSSGVYNAISTAVGIGASMLGKGPSRVSNYWVGSNAAKGLMSALDALYQNR